MYCLYQNPTIIFEPVSSNRYKLTCVPIHAVWSLVDGRSLGRKWLWKLGLWSDSSDVQTDLWYEHNSLYLMPDTSLFQTKREGNVHFFLSQSKLPAYTYIVQNPEHGKCSSKSFYREA